MYLINSEYFTQIWQIFWQTVEYYRVFARQKSHAYTDIVIGLSVINVRLIQFSSPYRNKRKK